MHADIADDVIIYGHAVPGADPVPLLDLRTGGDGPLPDPAEATTPLRTGQFGPNFEGAALAEPHVYDADVPVVLVSLDARWNWTAHGVVVTARGADPTLASHALSLAIGRADRNRLRSGQEIASLYRLLEDPTRWVATTHRRPPLLLTRERAREAAQWSTVGVEHEWQVRRWKRYGVRKPSTLRQWRRFGYTDARIEKIAPYVPVPMAARQFSTLPPTEMMRWYSAGVLSEDAALRAKERGWRPGHLGHLTYTMYRCLNMPIGPLKDGLIELLDSAGPFEAPHAVVAFRAGLSLPAVIDLINSGRLAEEQDGLRLVAAMR